MTTVAIHLVEALVHAGVRRIYGVVGDSLNSTVDAVHHNKKIQWIHVRHEEAGALAACAAGAIDRESRVCAGSCGPGNLHLINGLFDASKTLAPVLAVPGLQLLLPACWDGKTDAALVANCHADVYLTRWG